MGLRSPICLFGVLLKMNTAFKDTLETTLELFNLLLAGEEISRSKNKELYEKFVYDTDVEELLVFIAEKNGLQIYRYNERLFICPGVENKVFGYTNDELKKRIPYISRNDELYLGYFIIMTLITMFYKESGMDTPINYVKYADLITEVSGKFEALIKLEDLEKISKDNQFNFADICKVWQKLPDAREDQPGGKNDKVAFVKNICQFLQEEELIKIDEERKLIFPLDRFKAIVYNFFEEKENKNVLFDFVYHLGGDA